METTGATHDIELTIEPGLSEDVQASTIHEILNRLYDKFSIFNLSIKNSDEKSYLYSTYYDSERSSNKPTHSDILKEMEEQKEVNKDLQ